MKRVMVDMSATLLHHGHIRLIQKAAKHGKVVVGLTTDEQILLNKGYEPELEYRYREEILKAISGVSEVVPTPWLITEEVLDQYDIDLLLHGHDNSNPIPKERLLVTSRTEGISSMDVRRRAGRSIANINNKKLMLTPGPAAVVPEDLTNIKPLFGRGDEEYQVMVKKVLEWVKSLAGQDEIMLAQGSATFSLELALHSFVEGNVLLVITGYYSERLERLSPAGCNITKVAYEDIDTITGEYDWVLCVYTETSTAFKSDLKKVKDKAIALGARLYVDATGSIGLEDDHNLADVTAFSSCKGLFGLTGATFMAYKKELEPKELSTFYFNSQTHRDKLVTGPYHAIASLYGVIPVHDTLRERVYRSKKSAMEKWGGFISRKSNQPLLCTYFDASVKGDAENIVFYTPRSDLPGSIICHFGEIHSDRIELTDKIHFCELKDA